MRQYIRTGCELFPLVTFFTLYYFGGILLATKGLLITSVMALVISYFVEKKLNTMLAISNAMIVIFGGITLYTSNSTFIMIKPTILYIIFALLLCYDIWKRKCWMRHIFGKILVLNDKTCMHISKQWCCFFIICAILNEIVWRNFSIDTWVNFKVFGFITLTFLMSALQLFTLRKKVI